MAALLAGLTESRTGWDQPSVYVLFIGAVLLLAGFVAVERRLASPMLDLSLFRRGDFVAATIAALASGAGVLSIMSLIPFILQRAMGAGYRAGLDGASRLVGNERDHCHCNALDTGGTTQSDDRRACRVRSRATCRLWASFR